MAVSKHRHRGATGKGKAVGVVVCRTNINFFFLPRLDSDSPCLLYIFCTDFVVHESNELFQPAAVVVVIQQQRHQQSATESFFV